MPAPLPNHTVVITDASCFIILHKIGAMPLLHQLFTEVITTPEIAAEFGFPLPAWVAVRSVHNKTLQTDLSLSVDPGEASAIALAFEISYDYLITDDRDARKLALQLGLTVIGTLGVLLLAKQQGHISLLAPYLQQISQTNFRMSTTLYHDVLKQAGEL
jgi:predicted nucleic acid-binding protein